MLNFTMSSNWFLYKTDSYISQNYYSVKIRKYQINHGYAAFLAKAVSIYEIPFDGNAILPI